MIRFRSVSDADYLKVQMRLPQEFDFQDASVPRACLATQVIAVYLCR